MTLLNDLRTKNKDLSIFHVHEDAFREFGKIKNKCDFNELIPFMDETAIPDEGNVYIASVKTMEQTEVKRKLEETVYGGMRIQIGYCNGSNSLLNGLEYHKGSEINIAVTDLILLLGKVQDINNNQYRSEKAAAFFIPKGTAVELYQTTLHFAPCKVTEDGFKCVVILQEGTNTPLEGIEKKHTEEDELLFMKNKWLLVHPERKSMIEKGATAGIKGDNIKVKI